MHQLRLLEMLVERETAVDKYTILSSGRVIFVAMAGVPLTTLVLVTLAIPTKATSIWVFQQINHLLGI